MSQLKVKNQLFDKLLQKILKRSAPEISVEEAFSKRNEAIFIDVRKKEEFEVSHIKNAIFTEFKNFDIDSLSHIDKNKTLIIYCSVGYRSEKVSEQLIEHGFQNVYNLYGGIFEWSNQGLPVINSEGKTTAVHPYNAMWSIWLNKN